MSIEKYIKKELLFSQLFIIIGLIAAITGFIFGYQKELMTGLTAGFLPTGIGVMVLYKYARKKPEMKKNIELENEERNIFINTKAGHSAFWVSYWYIFVAVILYNIIKITLLKFLTVTLFFMAIMYFTFVFIYHKKY
ncbi:hypothetical protein [Clostridium sp. BNL1100]|uniref:hypothetical protein n=1 Tax=Clostridium sp. BNL1100 TaxID=755731 RepID=UPI00024A7EB2|nr:hypothetical protein [Clostridium sp. BNL1100]AEY64528.1 hypothetical protein Clo1100_0239 [Clostridium sp. BNL1100]